MRSPGRRWLTTILARAALVSGDIAFRQDTGGHTAGPNWPTFLDWAGRYF